MINKNTARNQRDGRLSSLKGNLEPNVDPNVYPNVDPSLNSILDPIMDPKAVLTNAWKNRWGEIPIEKLTDEYYDYEGDAGDTLLHAAAHFGKLKDINPKYLTISRLRKNCYRDTDVFYTAASKANLDQIPNNLLTPEILTRKYSDNSSVLSEAIMTHHLKNFPLNLLTVEILLELADVNNHKCYIHQIADQGELNKLSPKLLTPNVVLAKDGFGNNALFYASRMGELKYIPSGILKKDELLIQNSWGETILHWAISSGRIKNYIPDELITEDALLIENKRGENIFHVATMVGFLDQIPDKFINEKTMLYNNQRVMSPIHLLMGGYSGDKESDTAMVKKILKKFSISACKDILKHGGHLGQYREDIKAEIIVKKMSDKQNNTLLIQ